MTAAIVTYFSEASVEGALRPLEQAARNGYVECIVVDNASEDATVDVVKANCPWTTIVASPINAGFARGSNQAIRMGTAPYILLLNPDATIDEVNLRLLVEFLENRPRAAVVSPAQTGARGELETSRGFPTPRRIVAAAAGLRADQPQPIRPGDEPRTVDWICGAVWLLRREAYDELGGFDPRYFMYFEETDLCLRAQRRGWEIWTHGKAVATHQGGASAKRTGEQLVGGCISRYFFESRYYYLVKHFGRPLAVATETAELALLGVRGAASTVLRRRGWKRFSERLQAPILSLPAIPPDAAPEHASPNNGPAQAAKPHRQPE